MNKTNMKRDVIYAPPRTYSPFKSSTLNPHFLPQNVTHLLGLETA